MASSRKTTRNSPEVTSSVSLSRNRSRSTSSVQDLDSECEETCTKRETSNTECKHNSKCEESDVLEMSKTPRTELSSTRSYKQKKGLDLEMEDPEQETTLKSAAEYNKQFMLIFEHVKQQYHRKYSMYFSPAPLHPDSNDYYESKTKLYKENEVLDQSEFKVQTLENQLKPKEISILSQDNEILEFQTRQVNDTNMLHVLRKENERLRKENLEAKNGRDELIKKLESQHASDQAAYRQKISDLQNQLVYQEQGLDKSLKIHRKFLEMEEARLEHLQASIGTGATPSV